ncbi:MAG: ferredoxin [Desulfamplus sp.]|nr:ferredoxin [Desulfamplus sp.]MBF0258871.1 ferredoxin [Desulfamplus sp.]
MEKNGHDERFQPVSENVPGRFYVDTRCIGCSVCTEIAPDHFATNHDEGYEYVYSQPSGEAEVRLCNEAMEICPVNAIGKRI